MIFWHWTLLWILFSWFITPHFHWSDNTQYCLKHICFDSPSSLCFCNFAELILIISFPYFCLVPFVTLSSLLWNGLLLFFPSFQKIQLFRISLGRETVPLTLVLCFHRKLKKHLVYFWSLNPCLFQKVASDALYFMMYIWIVICFWLIGSELFVQMIIKEFTCNCTTIPIPRNGMDSE